MVGTKAGSPKRILVVDDDPDIVDVISILLESRGHTCWGTRKGREATRMAAAFQPDVIMLDLGLPDFDGFDVTRELRATGITSWLIAMSGYAEPEVHARALAIGVNRFAVKPLYLDTLDALLAEADTVGARRVTSGTARSRERAGSHGTDIG